MAAPAPLPISRTRASSPVAVQDAEFSEGESPTVVVTPEHRGEAVDLSDPIDVVDVTDIVDLLQSTDDDAIEVCEARNAEHAGYFQTSRWACLQPRVPCRRRAVASWTVSARMTSACEGFFCLCCASFSACECFCRFCCSCPFVLRGAAEWQSCAECTLLCFSLA